jgi:hypothetical protein
VRVIFDEKYTMPDFSQRVYGIAKGYLDAARGRLAEIDAKAQEELDRALTRGEASLPTASSDDPMERAKAKIAAARQSSDAFNAAQSHPLLDKLPDNNGALPPLTTDPLATAYRIIGVPNGSDYSTVDQAVQKLRDRCAPSRFPQGSPEQKEAETILARIEDANRVLKNALDSTEGRFDKLEF